MGILNSFTSSSLGLKGSTPDKLKFKGVSAQGTPLGLNASTPESVNFEGPNVNSGLGFSGATPENVKFESLKGSFTKSQQSLKGNIPENNYLDNLPEKGITV